MVILERGFAHERVTDMKKASAPGKIPKRKSVENGVNFTRGVNGAPARPSHVMKLACRNARESVMDLHAKTTSPWNMMKRNVSVLVVSLGVNDK